MGVCCGAGNIDDEISNTKDIHELIDVMLRREGLFTEEQKEIKEYILGKIDKVTIINLDGLNKDILEKRIHSLEYLKMYNKELIELFNSKYFPLEKEKTSVINLHMLYSNSYVEKEDYELEYKKIENYLNN